MDMIRRSGAGELSELVGKVALPIDLSHRLHQFRARANAILAQMPEEHQKLIEAYAGGVDAGLFALSQKPFEYSLSEPNRSLAACRYAACHLCHVFRVTGQ